MTSHHDDGMIPIDDSTQDGLIPVDASHKHHNNFGTEPEHYANGWSSPRATEGSGWRGDRKPSPPQWYGAADPSVAQPGRGRTRTKLVVFIAILMAISIGLGLGLGLGFGLRRNNTSSDVSPQSATTPTATPAANSTPTSGAPVSTTTGSNSASTNTGTSTSTATQSAVTAGLSGIAEIPCKEGDLGNTSKTYVSSYGNTKFQEACFINWPAGNNKPTLSGDGNVTDMKIVLVYTFEACMDMCAQHNLNLPTGSQKCGAVYYGWNLTALIPETKAGNCWFKSGRGVLVDQTIEIEGASANIDTS